MKRIYKSKTIERRALGLCIRCDTPSKSYYCLAHAKEHSKQQSRRNKVQRKIRRIQKELDAYDQDKKWMDEYAKRKDTRVLESRTHSRS